MHAARARRSRQDSRAAATVILRPVTRRTLSLLSAAAAGYLVGTTPSARLIAQLKTGGSIDLSSAGSGNPGALNALRLLGRRAGVVVVVADVGKGIAACVLGRRLAGDSGAHLSGVAAVAGHCYPLWTGFRGGKGVATSFGQCLYTFPVFAPVDAAVAVAVGRRPGVRRPALASVAASSTAWLLASVLWWRRGGPNLWGPRPTAALPLANAATVAIIASRAARRSQRERPDEFGPRQ